MGRLPAAANRRRRLLSNIQPTEMDRIAFAAEEGRRLVERQPDDVGKRADDLDNKASGDALRRVAAGLAAPFAGGEIGLNVLLGQPLEAYAGLHVSLAKRLLGRHQTHRRVNTMIAPGQKPQTLCRLVEQLGLRQDATADGHYGICGENKCSFEFLVEPYHGKRGFSLAAREPRGASAR